jgi:hypothetical protein
MWTPKRLLLLLLGFVLFFACFQVYVFFLGKYDGLPPLPDQYRPTTEASSADAAAVGPRPNHAVTKLIEAFGSSCEEQFRRIKLEWRLQGIVVAADRWQLLDNGQLRLTKVSVALFGKAKKDAKGAEVIEINTIRGEQADIEFDRPITDKRDAFNRRPVAGKLVGRGMKVELRNNRSTAQASDDVRLYTDWLAYSDQEHRIWTNAEVRLVDSEPEQARVTATGMEVVLIPAEEKQEGKGKEKTKVADRQQSGKKPTISGVKHVRLGKDVCMNLLIDAKSAFLGSPVARPADAAAADTASNQGAVPPSGAAPPRQPSEKTPVVVTSHGPFFYEVESDRAEFSDRVTVIRKQEAPPPNDSANGASQTRYDQLECDKLVLLFNRKKSDDKAKPANDEALDLDLMRADATGKQIELMSDAELLHATGTELVYDKANNQTMLRGEPVEADRDGNHFRVHGKLIFQNPTDGRKEIQDARAEGPGELRIRNADGAGAKVGDGPPNASKPQVERVARWQKEMHVRKEGGLDRLDFIGQASFDDPEQGKLQGDQIVVWLEERRAVASQSSPSPQPPVAGPASAGSNMSNRVPRRLEAVGKVSLDSRELKITQTDYLRLQFEDAKPGELTVTSSPKVDEVAGPATALRPSAQHANAPTPKTAADASKPTRADVLPPGKEEVKEPLLLTARTVDVKLLLDGKKADLKEVRTEGQVLVTRRPIPGKDRGIEIRGDRLDLFHQPEGHVLKVTGQANRPAYVQLDRLTLLGTVVNIDQPANNAWVNGPGSMKLPTKTDFQGNPLKEPTEVTIYWSERMFFDGKIAEFGGNVQAEQGDLNHGGARLACQELQVFLDRTVSLKETQGQAAEQPAALHRMLGTDDCRLEKGVREGDTWRQYQRIEGKAVVFDNPSSQLNVSGPGTVHMLHEGAAGDLAGVAPPPSRTVSPAKPVQPAEMKLTRIEFGGHMAANKASGVVTFLDRVRLVHLPATHPDTRIDLDALPPGGMWLACNKLQAVSKRVDKKTVTQEFVASDRVRIKGRQAGTEFSGQADLATYDESKDQLILEGQGSSRATLARQVVPGRPPEKVSARKIWFYRHENRVRFDDTDTIQVNPGGPNPAGLKPAGR